MKTAIGASLPALLFREFIIRSESFPGGKSAMIREALRSYFSSVPLTPEQVAKLQTPAADPQAL